MKLKVILTGAQAPIGQGVLHKCLANEAVGEVLSVGRWPSGISHPKLKELIVTDLIDIDNHEDVLVGYHACFYCSRIIPDAFDDELYAKFAIDPAMSFASRLLVLNPNIVFSFLSKHRSVGANQVGKIDGMIELALTKLAFRKLFFFRTHIVLPMPGQNQRHVSQLLLAVAYRFLKVLMPGHINTSAEIGSAMINAVLTAHDERIITSNDISRLAAQESVVNYSDQAVSFLSKQ